MEEIHSQAQAQEDTLTGNGPMTVEEVRINRRKELRKNTRWQYRGLYGESKAPINGYTVDLSPSGLRISNDNPIESGENIYLELQAFIKNRSRTIKLLGIARHKVLSQDSFHIGIQIKRISADDKALLKKHILS